MKYRGPSLPLFAKYLLRARSEPANILLELSERYGGVVHARVGRRHAFLVTCPDGVGHILQENQHNYHGFQYSYDLLQPLLGNGLLTSDGETWRRHRRIAQQAFHRQQLEVLSATMVETIQEFLIRWEGLPGPGKVIDIGSEMTLLTLSVVTASLFGANIEQQAETVKDSLPKVMHYLFDRMVNPLASPQWLPTRKNREYRDALHSLNTVVQSLIAKGRQRESEQTSLMGMFMAARDHGGKDRLDDEELHDEAKTVLMAGHETCANALTWTFYLLALHPEIQECLAEEVQRLLNGRPPSYADIPQLPYTGMVFNEVLRLYPPAWIMARDVITDDVIDGNLLPAGSFVFLSPYVNHRLPSLWQAPSHFDPERFAPNRLEKLPRFAYFPFGGGQRLCLGKNFALVEAALAISMMIQRYKFSLLYKRPGELHLSEIISPDIDMRPKTPIALKIEDR